jgi:hypothetical protein
MALYNPSVFKPTKSSTATSFDVNAVTISTTLLAVNNARNGALIWNNSTSDLIIDFDEEVTATSFSVRIAPDGYYELPFLYTGVISGLWETANGKAIIREFTE